MIRPRVRTVCDKHCKRPRAGLFGRPPFSEGQAFVEVNYLTIACIFPAGLDLYFPAGLSESFMPDSTVTIRVTLNGQKREFTFPAQTSALTLLRDKAQLTSVKEGCGIGECGACTILVDGRAVNACLLLAAQLDQTQVFTVEGLKENKDFRSLQESFMGNHAVQCGFCTPGLLISSYALGRQKTRVSREDIVASVSGNICRCTGYEQIVSAIENVLSTPNAEQGEGP